MNTIVNAPLELQALYPAHIKRGLLVACILHCAAIALIQLYLRWTGQPNNGPRIVLQRPYEWIPQQSIVPHAHAIAVSVSGSAPPIVFGLPVPVPEAEINPEQIFADQDALGTLSDDPVPEGEHSIIDISEKISLTSEVPPEEFVPVEIPPKIISSVNPVFPEIPRRAGVEGTVWVKIWITLKGNVKKAIIVRSDSELFNEESIKAAVQWKFTPAIMNNGPVEVWVTVPFKFRMSK